MAEALHVFIVRQFCKWGNVHELQQPDIYELYILRLAQWTVFITVRANVNFCPWFQTTAQNDSNSQADVFTWLQAFGPRKQHDTEFTKGPS